MMGSFLLLTLLGRLMLTLIHGELCVLINLFDSDLIVVVVGLSCEGL